MSPPPALPGLSSRVFERTLGRLQQLQEELEALKRAYADREDLPGTQTLLGAMRLVLNEAERQVVRRARTLHENPTDVAQRSFRGRIGGLLSSIEQLLPGPLAVARRPHGREIEALVGPFTSLAVDISPAREVIFEPGDDYEFQDSLIEEMVSFATTFSDQLAASLTELPHLTVITYPTQLDGDTLLHAVIAHEIAHLALDRIHPGEPASIGSQLINTSIDRHFDTLLTELKDTARAENAPMSGDRFARREREARQRVKKWFDELACDSLALSMVGPAYLFALADLDLPTDRWAQKRGMLGYGTHPGLAWRLRRLLPAAREFFGTTRDSRPWREGRRALDELEAMLPHDVDELGDVERRIIDDALDALEVPETTSRALRWSGLYLKGEFANHLDIVWEKVALGIPPAERILSRSRSDQQPSQAVATGPQENHAASQPSSDKAKSPAGASGAHNAGIENSEAREDDEVLAPEYWSVPIDFRSILNGCWLYWLSGEARSTIPRPRAMPLSGQATRDWREFNAFVRGTIELAGIHEELQGLRDRLDVLNFKRI